MSPRTIYLSRLIGLFTLVVTASMIIDKPRAIETMTALVHDRSALLIMGVLATAAGMAIVLAHQVWRGGRLPVVVTLLGWVILLRGIVLLLLSQPATVRFVAWRRHLAGVTGATGLRSAQAYRTDTVIVLAMI